MPPVKPLFGTPLNRAHPLAQGLVGAWLLNENSGNRAYDSSGYGNHGTLSGFSDPATPTRGWCAGPHGGALAFDGTDDYISIPNNQNLNISAKSFTIVTHFCGRIKESTDSIIYAIDDSYYFDLRPAGTGKLDFRLSGLTRPTATTVCDNNNWYLGAIVVDRINNKLRFFLDSKEDGIFDYIAGNLPQTYIRIGGRQLSTAQNFKGVLQSILIYSRALSPSEVSLLNADPYCMFREDDDLAMYQNHVPAIMAHNRRLVA